nr:separase isoform X1 [Ipomoea batatas]
MGSAADASAGLLSELQSAYEFSGKTYGKFSKHLHDFSTLPKPNKSSKSSENFTAIRALCRFLPFLNKSLSLLPKRISETSKNLQGICDSSARYLSVVPQLPRFNLFAAGRHQEAECEALSVLESLRVKMSKSKSAASKRRELLPPLNGASVDQEYAVLVMEAVLTLVKCASVKQSKEIADYDRLLDLVNEASSWIKALEASACEKIHHMLLKYLREIALFLAMDAAHFGGHLVCKFCKQIFDLYKGSSLRDDIWEVGKESTIIKFLKLVCYSAKKCRIETSVSNAVAMYFEELALNHRRQLNKPVDMNQFTTNSTIQGNTNDGSGFRLLLSQKDIIQKLEALLNLLKCHFARFIISEKNEVFTETESLAVVQDALSQYCHLLCQCQSAPDSKQDVCDDNNRSILVAVAAFTLSFRTKHNIQALEALKLCSKASWAHVLRSCEMFPHRSDEFQSELSEDAVMGFINDACVKIAKLLDVLYPSCSSNEADEILTDCLKSWSVTKALFGTLPNPIYVVKQFVKIRLKLSKDVDMEEGATLLHPILSSSEEFKGTELRAYKDLNVVNPSLCQKMRLKIISILLEKVYTTEDDYLPKSRILIAKCEELRAKGLCCECIPCLSEAISTLDKYFAAKERGGEKLSCMDPACHVVAYAYCIRALCTIEIEPNSKQLPYEDIRAALRVWMHPHQCHSSGQCNMLSGAMLNMLYQIIDLLSIKGNLDLHAEIFEMMIRLYKWKDITLETLLSLLWKHRRLGHALCALPINEFSVQALSKHFGEVTDSFEYWTNYLKESQPLLVGFQQSFHMIFALSSQRPCNHKAFLPPDISDDKVKLTASDLISNVPLSSGSAFLSAYLYYDLSERLILSGQLTETDTAADLNCTCYRLKCWHHLPNEAIQSGCMSHFIHLKWELVRRQLLQRMLIRLGKCLCLCNENHEAHKIFLQSVSLVTRDPSCPQYSSLPFVSLIDQIGKDSWAKLLAIDHVELLYNICWSALKSNHCKATRKFCCKNCDFSSIKISKIVSWLKLAFIQSTEIPFHFQKVSRLLAAVYVLSTSVKTFALPSSKVISESHWASFFHQASIGAHFNLQLFSTLMKHQNGLNLLDSEGSKEIGQGKCSTLRLAPGAVDNLEDFVLQYFKSLPSSTVVCISFIIGALASLLSQLLSCPSPIQAWILLSRMSSVNRPVVVIIPVHSILTEVSDFEELCSSFSFQANDFTKQWRCPWASGVIDDVAPIFRDILEKNHLSSSHCTIEDTPESRSLWWKRRRQLDQCLAKFLQDLEDFWLGPWRYLLLGELSECELQDSLLMDLADHMKLMNKEDVDMGLLNIVLGGANYAAKKGDCNLQMVLTNGSCIGGQGGYMPQPLSKSSTDSDTSYEPMLPWESLPILRDQEVYRMPSVGAINATLFRRGLNQEPVEKGAPLNAIPFIDPLDSYYVLNPSGDLSRTQAEFENWFKDQNFECLNTNKSVHHFLNIPQLSFELRVHFDMKMDFILDANGVFGCAGKERDCTHYRGIDWSLEESRPVSLFWTWKRSKTVCDHGLVISGGQYIPGQDIKELETCAASLLMGCSSGSLTSNGCYIPQGAPLYYLSAGSPIIVANLWEVTDKDIDRFGKKMLDAWFRERSSASAGCDQCSTVSEQFRDRPRAGSFMGEARKACFLRYLIGAAPVCYGVPTGITRKLD